MVTYVEEARGISPDMSFLEMLDTVNERLIAKGEEPIAFEHDCREGICGSCGMMINGQAHGPQKGTAACQLHMRKFSDGDEIFVGLARPGLPGAARPHRRPPGIRPHHGGGRLHHGPYRRRPRRQPHPHPQGGGRRRHGRAACIGCGACVTPAPTTAQLFTAAKLQHLNLLPQGQAERYRRTQAMVDTMEQYFGSCTMHGECLPQEISVDFIAYMNRDYVKAQFKNRKLAGQTAP